ncbi:MAG TPA: hypothetical protein VLX44_19605 [Xanthobacteraceae bacterium]|nr:hypothetical protein [Xanthobacteraceae bacterium]
MDGPELPVQEAQEGPHDQDVAAAALLAGAAVMIPGLSPVQAHIMGSKGDRLDLRPYGTACSERGWPYFETSCLRDTASPTRQARTVRIVGTDRVATR